MTEWMKTEGTSAASSAWDGLAERPSYLPVCTIADHHLLEEDAEGKDVCCLGRGISPEEFWSDVARSSRDEPPRKDGRLGVIEARQAEIHDGEAKLRAGVVKHDIVGLDVPVDNTGVMYCCDAGDHLTKDRKGFGREE